jgi:hypothetical protein
MDIPVYAGGKRERRKRHAIMLACGSRIERGSMKKIQEFN